MEAITLDFIFIAGLFASANPLIIALVSNIGVMWPSWAKVAFSVVMAIVASVVAVAVDSGWGAVSLGDWDGFLKPLLIGLFAVLPLQYAAYAGIWTPLKVAPALAGVGAPKNPGE